MRSIDENTEEALRGSRQGDELVCQLWYDDRLIQALPVSSWSLSWDGDSRQKVQGRLTLEVKDPDGMLGPWVFDDPLGVGGSRLQVFYRVGGAGDVMVGWYRITGNKTAESWQFRVIREDGYMEPDSDLPPHQRNVAVALGSSVSLTAEDLTVEIASDDFLAPEQPNSFNPSMRSEVARLIGDTVPVVWRNVDDQLVPTDVVWDGNRMETVMDLLELSGAVFRMTGNGELECLAKNPTPVFACAGGRDGVLINVTRSQSLADSYNIGVVTSTMKSTDADGREVDVPLYGSYAITAGPLQAGGPHGRRVIKVDNPLMDSQEKVDAAAKALVLDRLAAQTLDLEVVCLPNPAVQLYDRGIVVAPVVDGRQVPLTGEVVSMSLSGSGGRIGEMQLTLRCLLADAASALKGYSIADRITAIMPPVTYDSINPLRTLDQMSQPIEEVRG